MARGKKQVWCPMFELEVFRNQINCIEESTGDIVGIFRHLAQWFGAQEIVCPHVTPLTVQYLVETLLSTYVVGNTSSNESKLPKNADCSDYPRW